MSTIDHDLLGLRKKRLRTTAVLVVLSLLLFILAVMSLGIGAVTIDVPSIIHIISAHVGGLVSASTSTPIDKITDSIVWDIRIPRVILGIVVGAGLAVSGLVLQTMTHNPLADPQLLGINSGASSGAAFFILMSTSMGLHQYGLQVSAFIGALLAAIAVYSLAQHRGHMSPTRLILAGLAVGYALNALTSFLIFSSNNAEGSRSVMFWLLGSLSLAAWDQQLLIVVVVTVASCITLWFFSRWLDLLAAGDDTARSLGISPSTIRSIILIVVALCIGVIVSASGTIGFVGLVVPHLARALVGGNHRAALPVTALAGAILLVAADLAARTLLQPQELPIGILTALVGTPFLIILIYRNKVI